jgi:hypothetical protein
LFYLISKDITVQNCPVVISLHDGAILAKESNEFVNVSVSLSKNANCNLVKEMRIDFHTESFTATSSNYVRKYSSEPRQQRHKVCKNLFKFFNFLRNFLTFD